MGHYYIFGYGSLVSKASTAKTLGREPTLFRQATLHGWVRDWNIALINRRKESYFLLSESDVIPQFASALNVRPPLDQERPTNPNGILFDITEEELTLMDSREEHYERVDITQHISDAPEGIIYTYTGLSRFCKTPFLDDIFLPKSYLELVETGFNSFGNNYLEEFRQTTLPPSTAIKPSVFILRPQMA